jgi:hypothetical protein
MAKSKSLIAALIEAPDGPATIPYDPAVMQALDATDGQAWQRFNALRDGVYRRLMPTIWAERLAAQWAGNIDLVKQIEMDADHAWEEAMGVPALTSFENLEILMATIVAADYPPTSAGLHAWTIANRPRTFVVTSQTIEMADASGQPIESGNLVRRVTPEWRADDNELWFAGEPIRKVARNAGNLVRVLQAFQLKR